MLSLLSRLARPRSRPAAATPALLRDSLRRKDFEGAEQLLRRCRTDKSVPEAMLQALEGDIRYHQHRDVEAEQAFRRALVLDPGLADAHYGLSLLIDDPKTAAGHAQFAVNRGVNEPRYLAQLGYLHLCLGNPQAAERSLRAATTLNPDDANAWNNFGIVQRARSDRAAAEQCFQAALKADPHHAQARQNLEALAQDAAAGALPGHDAADDVDTDIDALEARWADVPTDADVAERLARAYAAREDFHSAANVLEQALTVVGSSTAVEADRAGVARLEGTLGGVKLKQRDVPGAAALLDAALTTLPDDVEFLLNLAVCRAEQEQHTRALPLIERALARDPGHRQARLKHLACLTNLCRYDEALALAQTLEAEGVPTDCTGLIHIFLGQDEAAEAWLSRRLAVLPHDPGLRFQRAQLRLSHLDFERGWDDYAYRGLGDSGNLRVLPFPLWDGTSIAGKRVVVLAEQGLGDQVMFASCLPDLIAQAPAALIVEAIDRIAPTLQRSFPSCTVIPTNQGRDLAWVKSCGEVDCYIPLADLPRHLRRSAEAFPAHGGYLQPNPARQLHWDRQQPPRRPGRLRIGLSWRGGTESTRAFVRSVDPAWMAGLADHVDADWVCLQYGDVTDELPLARAAGMPALQYWPEAIRDLDEFAALIGTLDLVVTVCNTTVHYAGALNVPVWILSPTVPEWRYGLHNPTLPWYPSSRMFRRGTDEAWIDTIHRLGREIAEWSGRR